MNKNAKLLNSLLSEGNTPTTGKPTIPTTVPPKAKKKAKKKVTKKVVKKTVSKNPFMGGC